MNEMLALLDDNVTLHGDGGGKVFALKRPLVGRRAVAQFVVAITGTLPADARVDETEINGTPGLIVWRDGRAAVAITVDTDGERISADKLQALAPQ